MPDDGGIVMYPDPPAHSPSLQPAPDEENDAQAGAQPAEDER